METVGIRDLKTNLGRHLKRVRSGVRLAITERGRTIATLSPVEQRPEDEWAYRMVADRRAHWNGKTPAGARIRMRPLKGHPASDAVLEDRR